MRLSRQWLWLGLINAGMFITPPVLADFSVVDEKPSLENPQAYGNAQTGRFHRAISGNTQLTAEEANDLAQKLPMPEVDHYYARFSMNFSTLTLDGLSNKSTGTDKGGAIAKKRASENETGFEIALGYGFSSSLRAEIEYLANKNLDYAANPALTGTGISARQLNAQIKNNTVLANVYYEFLGLNRFKPYLTVGLGPSVNSVQSSITAASYDAAGSTTSRKMGLAWALGGGLRVAVFSRWHINMSYRYIRLGSGLNIKPTGAFKLMGNSSMSAVSLGLMYYF